MSSASSMCASRWQPHRLPRRRLRRARLRRPHSRRQAKLQVQRHARSRALSRVHTRLRPRRLLPALSIRMTPLRSGRRCNLQPQYRVRCLRHPIRVTIVIPPRPSPVRRVLTPTGVVACVVITRGRARMEGLVHVRAQLRRDRCTLEAAEAVALINRIQAHLHASHVGCIHVHRHVEDQCPQRLQPPPLSRHPQPTARWLCDRTQPNLIYSHLCAHRIKMSMLSMSSYFPASRNRRLVARRQHVPAFCVRRHRRRRRRICWTPA
jgi:hypothetical protein